MKKEPQWKRQGFKSSSDYLNYLAKKKGFESETEYKDWLAQQKGFKSSSEQRKEQLKKKVCLCMNIKVKWQ